MTFTMHHSEVLSNTFDLRYYTIGFSDKTFLTLTLTSGDLGMTFVTCSLEVLIKTCSMRYYLPVLYEKYSKAIVEGLKMAQKWALWPYSA